MSYSNNSYYNWRSLYEEKDDGSDESFISGFEKRRKGRYHSSLGWGSELSDYYTRYYSSFSYTSLDTIEKAEELLNKSYSATREMIVILNFPFTVEIQLLGNTTEKEKLDRKLFRDNCRRLFIPTSVLDDNKRDDSEKINIMCGLGLHESAHLLYTEYIVLENFKNNILKLSLDVDSEKKYVLLDLINLIEDSRIEDRLLRERPGFFDFINNAKTWNYNNFKEKINSKKYNDKFKFLNTLYCFIRFPEFVEKKVIDDNSEIFKEVGEELSKSVPQTTKDSCKLSKRIFDLVKEHVPSVTDDYFGAEDVVYQKVLYGSDKESYENPSDKLMSNTLKSNDILQKLVYGQAERGSDKKTFLEKMTGNTINKKEDYEASYKRIRKYIPLMRKILINTDKNYDFVIHGCRSGLLDTSKIAEAYQGVPQVYIRQGHVVTNKTTICVLVDESGSMNSYNKDIRARDAAILLNEALGDLTGVDLYIYGHSADELTGDDVYLRIYREGNHYKPKYSLSNIQARCQNRDGDAILETAKRVRKFTQEKVIMFVISDGEPCAAGYYGTSARMDVKDKVQKTEMMNFDIIQISIDDVKGVRDMFDKFINIKKDLSELPKKLGQIIRNTIVDDKKTTVI